MFHSLKTNLLSTISKWWGGESESSPDNLRFKQRSMICGVLVILVSGIYLLAFGAEESTPASREGKVYKEDISKIETPLAGIDEREIWVNRMEKTAKAVQDEAARVKEENQFLQKRIDVLEELFNRKPKDIGAGQGSGEPSLASADDFSPTPIPSSTPPFPPQPSQISPQQLPPQDEYMSNHSFTHQDQDYSMQGKRFKKRGPKIAHLGGRISGVSFKKSDMYLPAGSYSKAVLTSGVAAATATNAQSNPQPIMLRLVDNGNLPRGFKSRVKDAVLLGGCYGDISSERVLCRLETMSWVEKDGTTVEKKVEGWVMGEDGRSGLRGEVVDRSSDVAREAFGAGLLSAVANFFRYEATTSVYPVTPFGQLNALKPGEAIQGAAASGASNALDKLADFSIKRAEQMQPVIMVASGRIVDVVFKTGVDLSTDAMTAEMKVVGSPSQDLSQENLED